MSRKPAALDSIETVNILGVNVAAVNMPQLVQVVTEAADSNTGGVLLRDERLHYRTGL